MHRHRGSRHICGRLLCASPASASSAMTTLMASHAARLGQPSANRASQVRTFATPRAPRPPPRAPKQGPSPTELYNLEGLSVEKFDHVMKIKGTFNSLSAAGYYGVAQRFADAIKNGANPLSVRLTGENAVSSLVLYEIGCIIRHTRPSQSSMSLSVALWTSASEMGNQLATISNARDMVRSGVWGTRKPFAKVETRFRQLVSEGKNPNALTVQGELLFKLAKYAEATRTLQKALNLGNGEFEWKTDCQLCLAKAYAKLQKVSEAKAILEEISVSGSPDVSAELGKLLLSDNSDKAEQLLYTAAINGKPDNFSQLSEIAAENQAKAKTPQEKNELRLWAMEWARLADPKTPF